MIRTVPSKDLKVGMYVILGVSWFRHSFPKSHFKLISRKQIKQIIATGIKKVKVDTSLSDAFEELEPSAASPEANDDRARQSRKVKVISKDKKGGIVTQSVVIDGGGEEQPGPDTATPQKAGPEGSGVDTIKMGEEDEWEDSGIDTVKLDERKESEGSGIDTIKMGEEDEWEDSGIDTIKMGGEDEREDSGIDTVTRDTGSGDPDTVQPPELVPVGIIAAELRATLKQGHLTPMMKASTIYQHSLQMMENLLANPNAENIGQGREVVRDIVDMIITEDEVANLMVLILLHDDHTETHSTNVGILSILLAKAALKDSSDHDLVDLGVGFFLHDLGMTQIPARLLSKPGKLSAAEWKVIRRHPALGDEILATTNVWTAACSRIILQHHEREDGTGYPQGLSGDDIDLSAQICRIADVYDALTSRRPYKAAPVLPAFQALETMKASMINHYNAAIFEVFVSLFSK